MVDVVTRPESLENKPLDTLRGPELSGVPGSLRAPGEHLDEGSALSAGQLRGTARPRLSLQAGRSFSFCRPQPLADGSAADAKLACDVSLGDALPVQGEGLKPSVFVRGSISFSKHAERLPYKAAFVK